MCYKPNQQKFQKTRKTKKMQSESQQKIKKVKFTFFKVFVLNLYSFTMNTETDGNKVAGDDRLTRIETQLSSLTDSVSLLLQNLRKCFFLMCWHLQCPHSLTRACWHQQCPCSCYRDSSSISTEHYTDKQQAEKTAQCKKIAAFEKEKRGCRIWLWWRWWLHRHYLTSCRKQNTGGIQSKLERVQQTVVSLQKVSQ